MEGVGLFGLVVGVGVLVLWGVGVCLCGGGGGGDENGRMTILYIIIL